MRSTTPFASPNHEAFIALAPACLLGPLIAYNLTPSATLFNQLAALASWGLAILLAAPHIRRLRLDAGSIGLLLLLAAPFESMLVNGLPLSLTLENAALIGAALMVYLAGSNLPDQARAAAFRWVAYGLLLAGLASLCVSVAQVFAPSLTDGNIVAHSGLIGRAVGNMRQPNHLASLFIWACVASAWLCDQERWPGRRLVLPVLLFLFTWGVLLSASRTGMISVILLTGWGAVDNRLKKATRWSLGAAPLLMGLAYLLMLAWHAHGHAFGAETRIVDEGAESGSRVAILRNTLTLIARNPWTGVGWGEFNLAWTMTPFPDRPVAFFDHCHDLIAQLVVELGLPVGLLVLVLLGATLYRAVIRGADSQGTESVARRAALMMVLTIGLHSLLEYPLWYAYFLLPASFVLGLASGQGPTPTQQQQGRPAGPSAGSWTMGIAGIVLVLGSAYAVWDYLHVVSIYMPSKEDAPLDERIKRGQASLFFAAQADYAAATSTEPGAEALAAAKQTGHNLIDVRLMMDWARSLHATGDDDRARYVVQRLREFRSPEGKAWLDECNAPPANEPAPFQCEEPKREYNWREMR